MIKKITTALIAVLLLTAIVLGACSCSKSRTDYGLHYELSSKFEKITVPYSENCYFNGEAYFYFNPYSDAQMEEQLGIDPDISVLDYTIEFLGWNLLSSDSYTYDEASDKSIIKYEYEYEDDVNIEDELYYHVILRGSKLFYVVTMSCPLSLRDTYEPMFDEIAEELYAE